MAGYSLYRYKSESPFYKVRNVALKLFAVYYLVGMVFSSEITLTDYRGASPLLRVQLHRTSPAFAALEDERDNYSVEVPARSLNNVKILTAGKPININKLIKGKDSKKQEPENQEEKTLKGLRISMNDMVPTKADQPVVYKKPIPKARIYDSYGDLLPVETRKRNLAAEYSRYEWSAPSFSEKAKSLVSKELKQKVDLTESRVVEFERPDKSVAQVYIGNPNKRQIKKKPPTVRNQKPNRINNPPVESTEPQSNNSYSVAQYHQPLPPEKGQLRISGNIRMAGGLAYISDQHILEISHVIDGFIVNDAQVWPQEAKYEMAVDELKGYLVAELFLESGELIGMGEVSLFDLAQSPEAFKGLKNIELRLLPEETGIHAEVISARSFNEHQMPLEDAKLYISSLNREVVKDSRGTYKDSDVLTQSSYIVRAENENHWGTLMVGQTDRKMGVKVFPNSMVDALLSLTLDKYDLPEAKDNAVIWGRVLLNGKPVAGATVELAGESDHQPIYFNGYIPNKKLQKTSSNGLFAFVNVNPGIQSVRTIYNGKYLPAQIVPTEREYVSFVELHQQKERVVSINSFEAFDENRPVPSVMNILGTNVDIEIPEKGHETIKYPGGKGMMLIEAESSEEYMPIRLSLYRKSRYIHLPMVRKTWVDNIALQGRVNTSANRGIAVGFVRGDHYEVFVDDLPSSVSDIIYFDSNGQILHKKEGVPGGGFIIFNLPEGLQTVTILPAGKQKIMTKTVVSDSEVANIIQADL